MLLYQIIIFCTMFIINFFDIRFPEKIKDAIQVVVFILIIGGFLDGYFSLIGTTIIMMITGWLLGTYLKEFETKSALITIMIAVVIVILNRGIVTRIYDETGCVSFWEEYNFNAGLKSISHADGDNDYFLITSFQDEESQAKLMKLVDKLKNREFYFIVVLYYDEDFNVKDIGYAYHTKGTPNFAYEPQIIVDGEPMKDEWFTIIKEQVEKEGLSNCDQFIPNMLLTSVQGEIRYDENGDFNYADSDVGVHWVDDYYRGDGTHVDGYWRTNPDGDPTNNFGYSY